jgi:type IV secretion system protein VirD4
MAGYGIKAFLIAQSLNQIEKAYGLNNAILDNCHVRVSFATNDERTAKRISDALGTATELRAMKNYAGHRLSPWLGHLMVSRTETARALLTPGEVMQLPPGDEIVMVAGLAPIRARKARYFKDRRLTDRVLTPAVVGRVEQGADDWSDLPPVPAPPRPQRKADGATDAANGGIRQEPELPVHEDIVTMPEPARGEFDFGEDSAQADAARNRQAADRAMRRAARAASLDPDDGIEL